MTPINQRIVVQFENQADPGFSLGHQYVVLAIESQRLLLVNDDARLAWVESSSPVVVSVERDAERIFELETHRFRLRLEALVGKRVVFTAWENIGFDPDEVTSDKMLLYRGRVERYDGETLFLQRLDTGEAFGILPRGIATLDEEAE